MFSPKREYDLILSCGQACNCSSALRSCGLQNCSYPFDWQFKADFATKVEILKNRFERYFELKDLEFVKIDSLNDKNMVVKNNYTNIFFNHDFFVEKGSIETQYPTVREKYNRRINRVLEFLDKNVTKKVLLVYYERTVCDESDEKEKYSVQDLNSMINELEKIYPHTIFNILYVKSSDKMFPNKIKLENSRNKKIMLAITYNRYKVNFEQDGNLYKNLINILSRFNIRYKNGTNRHLFKNRIRFLFYFYSN